MNISAFCKTSYDWNPINQAVEPIPNRFALCKCPRQLVHVDQASRYGNDIEQQQQQPRDQLYNGDQVPKQQCLV